MDEKKRVLIVDDEKNIVNILKFNCSWPCRKIRT